MIEPATDAAHAQPSWSFTVLFPGLNYVVFLALLLWFVSSDYPLVGHDFSYFVPRLNDTLLHYLINGATIQWYTPSFGSGMPAFPNPQHIQFSLPQLLTFATDPWHAALLSVVAWSAIGYVSLYLLLTRVLMLHATAATLGSLVLVANGFFIQHVSVGHVTFQPFPMVATLLLAAFAPSLPIGFAGVLIGVILAAIIHQGGFFIVVVFALTMIVLVPVLLLASRKVVDPSRLVRVFAIGCVTSLLLCASKLHASFAFLDHFPRLIRDDYQRTVLGSVRAVGGQLLGVMTLQPVLSLVGGSADDVWRLLDWSTGTQYGLWELDIGLPAAIWVIIGVALVCHAASFRATARWLRVNVLGVAAVVIALWMIVDLSTTRGVWFEVLSRLPVMRSLHVNVRYVSGLIVPLAVVAALLFNHFYGRCADRRVAFAVFVALDVLSLASLYSYVVARQAWSEDRVRPYKAFELTPSVATWRMVKSGETFPVVANARVTDADAFAARASSLITYEPIFGYGLKDFAIQTRPGDVHETFGGAFNMTHPAGYVFPEVNRTQPFGRIPAEEARQLDDFLHRRTPAWELPGTQVLADCVSGIALMAVTAYLLGGAYRLRRRRATALKLPRARS